jgi:uncharacterized protein
MPDENRRVDTPPDFFRVRGEPSDRMKMQKMRDTPKKATHHYLQLTFAFSVVVWTLIIWSGHLYMGFGLMIPAIMWCPALAAVVTCRRLGREFRSLAWRWPSNRYIAAA